jgi:DNA-binding GntR family transcriptional regulator
MPLETIAEPGSAVSRHRVRDQIEAMILNGQFRSGSKLVQQELGRQLGVAQGVIREALLELQSYGLVETVDNRGVFVSELTYAKLREAYDVREMHEGLAARLSCDRITRTQVRELVEMAQRMAELAGENKLDEMGSLDREFHHRLLEIAGNSMLLRLVDNYRVLGKVVRVNRDPEQVRKEHLAILKPIEEGKPEEAERLMREHIRAGKQAVEEQVARGEFVPHWVV